MTFDDPAVTVDVIIFTIEDETLKLLLVERKNEPFKETPALPGGFIDIDESLDDAATRILEEKTGVTDVYLEQLYTFGRPERDSRKRVITVSYFAIVNQNTVTVSGDDADWSPVRDLPDLAFDHDDIISYAEQRLQWKLEYTTAAFSFLSDTFTMSELQSVYETVFDRDFDKRNFRRKIKKHDLVDDTGQKTENVSHRPATLYRPNKDIGEIVEIL